MNISLKSIGATAAIIVSVSGAASAAVYWNPFVLKAEYEPVITLIGGDSALNIQLRIDSLEQDLFVVQDLANRERAQEGRVSESTRRRLLNIQSQINTLRAKLREYGKVLDK